MLHKPLGKRAVVFHDPNYPQPCSEETLHTLIPGEFHLVEASHLAEVLTQDCNILISFHGPYFPKSAWAAILRFLEAGGNLALFGGMPFTRPVTEQGTIEPEQQAYTDQMHLGPFFPLALPATDLSLVASREATFLESCPLSLPSAQPGRFWSCYPQMTQASDHPEDLGSAGPLDTLLTPLLFVNTPSSPAPLATPAALFDQQHGRFKGGRWLVSAWQPSSEDAWLANTSAIRQLIQLAAEGCAVLDVYPALACYQTGEQPELKISARTPHDLRVSIKVSTPRGDLLASFEIELAGSPFLQEVRKQLPVASEPGLYNIEACYARGVSLRQQSGFWLWDG
ncbi:MAG: hypothetical protein J2P37_29265, partial [Ktedonobacteraceae bacterium]|nr:hypothetical protein [Ktedonobacteraceae bacterium]